MKHKEVTRNALKLKPLKMREALGDRKQQPGFTTKERKHWKETFQDDVAVYEVEIVRIEKLQLPRSVLSCKIYEHTDECETYEEAVGDLEDVFSKTPDKVFARHLACNQQTADRNKPQIIICKSFDR